MEAWRRLGDADAVYLPADIAVPGEFTPVAVQVFERGFPDEDAVAHLREVIARLLPALRCRLVRDKLSPALPRWVDVADFDAADHMVELPVPGDGSMRAILDWAADWADAPMPKDRPPWRFVFFRDVTVAGVPGRMVSLAEIHHTVIDGEGGRRMAERFLQWGPDEPMPEMPEPPPPERIRSFARWREGWAIEGRKLAGATRIGARNAAWATRHPVAGARRARETVAAMRRFTGAAGTETMSPLLRRQSDRLRFDVLAVDVPALKAGARAAGGSVNDGLLAALSLALRQWHVDHGTMVPAVRTSMAMNVRPDDGSYRGNDIVAVMFPLPIDDDDVAGLVRRCRDLSAARRGDRDALVAQQRAIKLANRVPAALTARPTGARMAGIDVQVSNVNGIPAGFWLGGVENLRTVAFPGSSRIAIQLIFGSTRERADIGLTTCPIAIHDPDRFVALLDQGFQQVAALAG